jgi:hypothetical protein
MLDAFAFTVILHAKIAELSTPYSMKEKNRQNRSIPLAL